MELSPPEYAFVAPTGDSARDLGYDTMRRFLGDWPYETKASSPQQITFPQERNPDVKATVHFTGAQAIDNFRGRHLDGVVIDEYSEMPGIWKAAILPMLSDYSGWVMVIGTPKGRNAFHRLFVSAQADPNWGVHFYPATETGLISEEELAVQRANLGDDLFGQEFLLDWTATVTGAYYGQLLNDAEKQGRMGQLPHDPNFRVNTAWDIGIDNESVRWYYQQAASQIRIIDYDAVSGVGMEQIIHERVIGRKDHAGRPYRYGTHFLPHDAEVRDTWLGKTRHELAVTAFGGEGAVRVVMRRSIDDGIEEVRRILPRCYFDRDLCAYGIDMLSLYRPKIDADGIPTKPKKDETTHAADAFRTLAMGLTPGVSDEVAGEKRKPEPHAIDINAPMGELRSSGPRGYNPRRQPWR